MNNHIRFTKKSDSSIFFVDKRLFRSKIGYVMYVGYVPEINCVVTRNSDLIRPRISSVGSAIVEVKGIGNSKVGSGTGARAWRDSASYRLPSDTARW